MPGMKPTPGPWDVGPEIDSENKLVYINIFAQGRKSLWCHHL